MRKKNQIFDELMEGFLDAIARKKGHVVALRVTEILRAKLMRPRQMSIAQSDPEILLQSGVKPSRRTARRRHHPSRVNES